MHLEVFSTGNSFVHKIDPRVKLIVFVVVIIFIVISSNCVFPLMFLLIGFCMLLTARLRFKLVLQRLSVVNFFILFLWLIMPFSCPGRAIVSFGALTVTQEGINFAAMITLRANAIFILAVSLIGTTPVLQLAGALRRLGIPLKIVNLFYFCYKYISIVHSDYTKINNALKIKCFKPHTSLHTYKTLAYLIGILLIRSYEHAERMYNALKCRGFTGVFPVLTRPQLRSRDIVFLLAMISIVISGIFI